MSIIENDFSKEEKKWSPLIGQIILDFANIEEFFYEVINFYLRKSIIKTDDINGSFDKRLDLFVKIIKSELTLSLVDKNKLDLAIKQIQNHKTTRNLVAHNSIGLMVNEDENGNMRISGYQIVGRKNEKVYINLEMLENSAKSISTSRKNLGEILLVFYEHLHKTYDRETLAHLLRSD